MLIQLFFLLIIKVFHVSLNKKIVKAEKDGTKYVKIMVPLKYLSNFQRTFAITDTFATFAITDTKLYVPAVTLSTQGNAKSQQQLKSGLEIKSYNVMIHGRNFFYLSVKKNQITYDSIPKIAMGQGDDYATGCCLLDYVYFKNYYKMIAIDLSKQEALDADPKKIQ